MDRQLDGKATEKLSKKIIQALASKRDHKDYGFKNFKKVDSKTLRVTD